MKTGCGLFVLHWLTIAVAVGLIAFVAIGPWLDPSEEQPIRMALVRRLFARDTAMRRVAVVSAIGLIVTARVFFRSRTPQLPDAGDGPCPTG